MLNRLIGPRAPAASRAVLLMAFVCLLVVGAAGGMNCVVVGPPNGDDGVVISPLLNVRDVDHVLGDANAPVTIVEYSDFQCPVCGRFAREVFPTIRAEFIDTGQVRWVVRHYPLRVIHECAEPAARGSECAHDQGAFFSFHDFLYTVQDSLCNNDLKQHARNQGLDGPTFDQCLDSASKAERVQQDVDSGQQLGITGTPTFFINGLRKTGFQSIEQMRQLIQQAMP